MAFSALEALQAFGAGRQMAQQDRQIRTREQAGASAASGDFPGAEHTALAGGDFELATRMGQLSDAEKARLLQETSVGGQLAEGIRALPVEQRAAAFAQGAPLLRGVGFHDSEIQALGADLSDAALDSHVRTARIAQRQLRPNAGPLDVAPGHRFVDPATGAIIADGGPPPPTEMQRDYEWLRANHPDQAASFLGRRTDPAPLTVRNDDGTITIIPQGRPTVAAPQPQHFTPQQLRQQADEAIAAGAPRDQVEAEYQRMITGGPASAPDNFPRQDGGAFDFAAHP